MEQTRFYPDMSPEQQLQWVTDFAALMTGGGDRIVSQARQRQPQWQSDDAQTVRRIVEMLAAWPFAADFCDKARRYGDYMARTSRLPVYIDKVKERLADGLTMTDADGRTVAYVSPSAPMRRRGRPSAAEVAARLRGETLALPTADSPDNEKRRRIAAILGLQVVVHGQPPREKNNAEIAAEKAARRAAYDRQNPSLFAAQPSESSGTGSMRAVEDGTLVPVTSDSPAPQSGSPAVCPTMSEVYQDRIEQDRLRLSDLAWLCSDDLRKRIETVRALRVTAESASERAKTMADLGQPADAIAPYAQQAKEAVEGYMAIYQAVDEELATVFYRLQNDEPYREKFLRRFKGVDLVKVSHICRPYYEKLRSPELDLRIRTLIEQESPEYAAKMKAEEEKKQELQALHRYIMRKDKEASDERVRTMTERIARVRELAGDSVADTYLPVLNKTIEDNKAWRAAKSSTKKSTDAKSADKKPSPKKSAKK